MARKKPEGVSVPARIQAQIMKTKAQGSSGKGKDEAKKSIDRYSEKLLDKAAEFAGHAKRKRINDKDVELAEQYLIGK